MALQCLRCFSGDVVAYVLSLSLALSLSLSLSRALSLSLFLPLSLTLAACLSCGSTGREPLEPQLQQRSDRAGSGRRRSVLVDGVRARFSLMYIHSILDMIRYLIFTSAGFVV